MGNKNKIRGPTHRRNINKRESGKRIQNCKNSNTQYL